MVTFNRCRARYVAECPNVALDGEEGSRCSQHTVGNTIEEHDRTVRDLVLEEAAKACDAEVDEYMSFRNEAAARGAMDCADRIRELTSSRQHARKAG
jgi:hypothetical protein